MPSLPTKTQSPLQNTEALDASAYLFWLFCVFYNATAEQEPWTQEEVLAF